MNTEAETAADIAATMLLPAAARHLVLLKEAGLTALAKETAALAGDLPAIKVLQDANVGHPEGLMEETVYMRDTVLPAMGEVRRGRPRADRRRRPVAAAEILEILFIK